MYSIISRKLCNSIPYGLFSSLIQWELYITTWHVRSALKKRWIFFSFKKTECTQIFAYRNLKIGKTDGTVNDVFCSFSGDFKCPCSHTRCEQPCALLHVRTLLQNRLRGTWKIMLATRMVSDTWKKRKSKHFSSLTENEALL